MLKASEYHVNYNFYKKADGRESCLDIKTGFKTYKEAEEWSHANTIDGRVYAVYPVDGWEE